MKIVKYGTWCACHIKTDVVVGLVGLCPAGDTWVFQHSHADIAHPSTDICWDVDDCYTLEAEHFLELHTSLQDAGVSDRDVGSFYTSAVIGTLREVCVSDVDLHLIVGSGGVSGRRDCRTCMSSK